MVDVDCPDKPTTVEVHEEGDLLVVSLRGEYDLQVERYMQFLRGDLEKRHGYRLILIHVGQAGTITTEARREMVTWNRGRKAPGAVAILGASFTARTLANMVLTAGRLLTKRHVDFGFFESEGEARAWLAERRKDLRALVP
ncbi:STAS/SEC14 domain-containing protein [Polyangium sp. y55x31]|uniref:STAS/SEC14 domain-containing protein n=1 Tax=Polyangium sp. y55x31 TaxID=3042688 RepID=UPI002482D97E|nr:STAS/SEC14 domain-containing protein [Polyangium sp. y55x31]MDI1481837.1 STAS/SEC14 domain-containing protein [Polyangium sp. y55x31]